MHTPTISTSPLSLHDALPISSYSGDYTGRRYSALTQITQANVKQLSLAWTARLSGATTATTSIGGVGTGDIPIGNPNVDRKSTRLNSSHLGISYAVFCLKKKI